MNHNCKHLMNGWCKECVANLLKELSVHENQVPPEAVKPCVGATYWRPAVGGSMLHVTRVIDDPPRVCFTEIHTSNNWMPLATWQAQSFRRLPQSYDEAKLQTEQVNEEKLKSLVKALLTKYGIE